MGLAFVLDVVFRHSLDGVDAAGIEFLLFLDKGEVREVFGVAGGAVDEEATCKADAVIGAGDGVEILVEGVDDGDRGRDFDFPNPFDGDPVDVLDEAPEDVVMGGHEDPRSSSEGRSDGILPVGHDSLLAHPKGFPDRMDVGPKSLVSPVPARPERMILGHGNRPLFKAPAESLQQFFPHLPFHFVLGHAL